MLPLGQSLNPKFGGLTYTLLDFRNIGDLSRTIVFLIDILVEAIDVRAVGAISPN